MHTYRVSFYSGKPRDVVASRVIPDKGFFMFYTYEPGAIFQVAKLVATYPMQDVRAVECIDKAGE